MISALMKDLAMAQLDYRLRASAKMSQGGVIVVTESPFSDVLTANKIYSATYQYGDLKGRAMKGLAVLTCMDSRIDPLGMMGLSPGDAKILRNAGARVTEDVLRTLVLAAYLLGVTRVMIVAHTDCRMTVQNEDAVHRAVAEAGGPDTRSLSFMTTSDLCESLAQDVQKIRSSPYLNNLQVGGFIYHLDSGHLEETP
jgi:carbonic anhydrase